MRTPALLLAALLLAGAPQVRSQPPVGRERPSIDAGWRDAPGTAVERTALLPWLLPASGPFIKDPAQRKAAPQQRPAFDSLYAQRDFDDASWRALDLPHDWGVEGEFTTISARSAPRSTIARCGVSSTGWSRWA
jgi:beta-galactosidase